MLRERLNEELKTAMKAKEARAVSTLRLILAALKDRDIAARDKGNGDGLVEDEILEMLQKMVRQRRESIKLYSEGGRPDLVERECDEIAVIERFLPAALTPEETATAIEEAVQELEAGSIKDMGRVMGLLKQRYVGRLDFAKVGKQVKARLGG